jgi:two-component system OmpR family response regulator
MDRSVTSRESGGQAVTALPPHIVAVDDDADVRALIAEYLSKNELRVTTVESGRELAHVMARETVDAIILDLRLRGEDGMQVAQRLRSQSTVPILMLTARVDEADRVMGLELGADDYLTKPFSPRELLARVRALVRRARIRESVADEVARVRAYRFGTWELNVGLRKLKSAAGQTIDLTNGEFSLLTAFLSAPRRTMSRDELLELSRLHNAEVYDRSIDVQILRLRRKIEPDPSQPQYILTERGAGYVLDAMVEKVQ